MASLSSLLAAARRPVIARHFLVTTPRISKRLLSEGSVASRKKDEEEENPATESSFKPPQDFVKVKLEPGEWDDDRTDPIDRPPWKSNAKIMSAEDFANRPQVGWGEEFDSMREAMVTLSWLDQGQCDGIYQMYLDMMSNMQRKEGKTSHEYVTRVIAQKHNISAGRVAAIVQLAHNEEQIKKEGGTLHYEIANEVDQQIKEHIQNAYEAYGEEPPQSFVEDPRGVAEIGDSTEKKHAGSASVEDLYDVDDLMSQTLVREKEEARLAIDNHIYIEDVDDNLTNVPIDANCQKLLNNTEGETPFAERSSDLQPLPETGVKKERFKYVAQIINTRDEKKKGTKKKKKGKRRHDVVEGNTLVEHDGQLRVATVAEVKETSWKPERNAKEFTYAGVKQAWVDRTVHSKVGTWGRFQDKNKNKAAQEQKPTRNDTEDESSSSESEGEDSSDSSDDEIEEEMQEEELFPDDEEEDTKKKKK